MGENHKEDILKCLSQWHDITVKQHEVLAAGDLDQFERLNRVSIVLQARFDNSISKLRPARLMEQELNLLKEIQAYQTRFIEEIQRGSQEVAKAIGTLRKNKNSMNGYRPNSPKPPRFKNERT
jgi:hypothetical protein